uniref:Uncharacterized protein n=1 Tax=Cannabis sativa TaxID=3483 RepID=A0A803P587_CANSA
VGVAVPSANLITVRIRLRCGPQSESRLEIESKLGVPVVSKFGSSKVLDRDLGQHFDRVQ